jgi:Holliday junction resolvase-like predicted endonuclease
VNIEKSTRHQKILGEFGEHVVCNWLSRSGFEVSIVDHTGIDLIAYHPETKQRMGITVKSRTRTPGRESESVNLLKKEDHKKLKEACESFGCEPWVGVYVESENHADLYLTNLAHYLARYGPKEGQIRVIKDWKMKQKHRDQYLSDPDVKHIQIDFHAHHWWT